MSIKSLLSLPILLFLLIISIIGATFLGAYQTSFAEVGQAMVNSLNGKNNAITYLIFHIRLPRILLAGLVGGGLAVAGAAIQGLFRNPLAEPSLIGITSGAMLFAVSSIVLMGSFLATFSAIFQQATVSIFAFIGGLLTTYLVYFLSSKHGRTNVMTMLLAGIAITAFAAAITGIFIFLSDDQQLRDITFWSLGSVSSASWIQLGITAPIVLIGTFLLNTHAKSLNAILLGEKEATYLGIKVEKVKSQIILITALIVGVSIAMTGIIGFVGLIIPHFLRLIFGTDYRFLLKGSALLGAIFLIIADTLARTIIAPAELPIGILTALVGAPFFLWLLLQMQRKNSEL
ncbi:MAG: iron complex transport system permease protein [Saprospiraceae bacterium]|jgi:iron complex transport system permease protein